MCNGISRQPTAKHIEQVRRVLRCMNRAPLSVTYKRVPPPLKIALISSRAFEAGVTNCLASGSGAFVFPIEEGGNDDPGSHVRVIQCSFKQQSHVVSTLLRPSCTLACTCLGLAW